MTTQRVLTMASLVACGHSPGRVTIVSTAKLKVTQNSVLLEESIAQKDVTGCSTKPASDSSGTTHITCTEVSAVTEGQATKLKVGGAPVILETLKGTTNGMVSKTTPQDLAVPTANQNKLKTVYKTV